MEREFSSNTSPPTSRGVGWEMGLNSDDLLGRLAWAISPWGCPGAPALGRHQGAPGAPGAPGCTEGLVGDRWQALSDILRVLVMASAELVRDGGKNKRELGVPLTVHSFFNIDQSPSLNLVFTHPQPSDTPGHMSPHFFLLSMANLHPSAHLAPHSATGFIQTPSHL